MSKASHWVSKALRWVSKALRWVSKALRWVPKALHWESKASRWVSKALRWVPKALHWHFKYQHVGIGNTKSSPQRQWFASRWNIGLTLHIVHNQLYGRSGSQSYGIGLRH